MSKRGEKRVVDFTLVANDQEKKVQKSDSCKEEAEAHSATERDFKAVFQRILDSNDGNAVSLDGNEHADVARDHRGDGAEDESAGSPSSEGPLLDSEVEEKSESKEVHGHLGVLLLEEGLSTVLNHLRETEDLPGFLNRDLLIISDLRFVVIRVLFGVLVNLILLIEDLKI